MLTKAKALQCFQQKVNSEAMTERAEKIKKTLKVWKNSFIYFKIKRESQENLARSLYNNIWFGLFFTSRWHTGNGFK